MDYSPYRKQSRNISAHSSAGIFAVFLVSSIIGFFLFWGIKTFFFHDSGIIILPVVQQNGSSVSVQIKGLSRFNPVDSSETQRVLSEGDIIRSTKGNSAAIIFENGTTASLGLGGELELITSRKNENNELFGEVKVSSAPVIFAFEGAFDTEKQFKVWALDNIYAQGSAGKVLFTSHGIHLLEGEKITIIQTDEAGKELKSKDIGIGQSLDLKTFALQGIPESVKYLPLYALHTNVPLVIPNPQGDIEPQESSAPAAVVIQAPVISTPNANGEIITVQKVPQILQGTAPQNAVKIMIEWENKDGVVDQYVLKNFTGATNIWKYSASPAFNTIAEGKNTYRVYALDAQGVKSLPASVIIVYSPIGTTENIYTTAKGNLVITSPNNGNNSTQTSSTISLRGTAPQNATYITVVNSTLGSAYTLQQYKSGNKRWAYGTGILNPGTYAFVVKAQNSARQTISSDKIVITITEKNSTGTSTPVPSSTPVPTITPTSTPVAPTNPASTFEVTR